MLSSSSISCKLPIVFAAVEEVCIVARRFDGEVDCCSLATARPPRIRFLLRSTHTPVSTKYRASKHYELPGDNSIGHYSGARNISPTLRPSSSSSKCGFCDPSAQSCEETRRMMDPSTENPQQTGCRHCSRRQPIKHHPLGQGWIEISGGQVNRNP